MCHLAKLVSFYMETRMLSSLSMSVRLPMLLSESPKEQRPLELYTRVRVQLVATFFTAHPNVLRVRIDNIIIIVIILLVSWSLLPSLELQSDESHIPVQDMLTHLFSTSSGESTFGNDSWLTSRRPLRIVWRTLYVNNCNIAPSSI